jgi:hypothetical protein
VPRADGEAAHTRSRQNNSSQVQGIGIGDSEIVLRMRRRAADGAQEIERFRGGELLA